MNLAPDTIGDSGFEYSTLEDLQLVRQYRELGDKKALDVLLLRYRQYLLTIVTNSIQNSDVDDVMQDIAVVVIRSLDQCYTDSLLPWIQTIARRQICDYHRRKRAEKRSVNGVDAVSLTQYEQNTGDELPVSTTNSPLTAAILKENKALLQRCLAKLTAREREYIELRYFKYRTPNEMVEDLYEPVELIREKLVLVKRRLRRMMSKFAQE
jgi:RNA polymerase sigma factor (sigma-70 family)